MYAKLICKVGDFAGSVFHIDKEVTVGRGNSNSIILSTKTISDKHARIYFEEKEQCYYLEDLGSTNGTWLDGMPVKRMLKLSKLNVITFANIYDFVFHVLDGAFIPFDSSTAPPGFVDKQDTRYDQEGINIPPEIQQKSTSSQNITQYDDGNIIIPEIPRKLKSKTGKASILNEDLEAESRNSKTQDANKASPNTVDNEDTHYDHDVIITPQVVPSGSSSDPPLGITLNDDESNIKFSTFKENEANSSEQSLKHYKEDKKSQDIKLPSFYIFIKHINKLTELKEGNNIVGRVKDCNIQIDHNSISRTHAKIRVVKGEILIEDLGSKNGTFFKGEAIMQEIVIEPGMEIIFGTIKAIIVSQKTFGKAKP